MRSAGVDPDSIATAFAVARDCLAEARELSAQARRELALAQYERDLARRRAAAPYPPAGVPQPAATPAASQPAGTASDPLVMSDAAPAAGRDWAMALAARTAIPDLPGTDLCPDPATARTPEEVI